MNNGTVLKKLLKLIGRHGLLFSAGIILSALAACCQLYVPVLFGRTIDLIAGPGNVDHGMTSVHLRTIAVLAAAAAFFTWLCSMINNRVAHAVTAGLRARTIRKIQRLPLSYLDSHPTGDLMQRMVTDCDRVSDGLLMGFTQLFTGVLTIICTLSFMFSVNWLIALVVVLLTPLSLFVTSFISSHT